MPPLDAVNNEVANLVLTFWPKFQEVYEPAKNQPVPVVSAGGGIDPKSSSKTHAMGIAVDIIPGDVKTDNNRQTLILFGLFLMVMRPDLTVYFYGAKAKAGPHVHIDNGTHENRPKFGTNNDSKYITYPRKYSDSEYKQFIGELRKTWESFSYTKSYKKFDENLIRVIMNTKEDVTGENTKPEKKSKKGVIIFIVTIVLALIVLIAIKKKGNHDLGNI